jgi:hypothetical protein
MTIAGKSGTRRRPMRKKVIKEARVIKITVKMSL